MTNPEQIFAELVQRVVAAFPNVTFKEEVQNLFTGPVGTTMQIETWLNPETVARTRGADGLTVRLVAEGATQRYNPTLTPDWSKFDEWVQKVRTFLTTEAEALEEAAKPPVGVQTVNPKDLFVESAINLVVGKPMTGKTALLKRMVEDSGKTKRVFVITDAPKTWANCKTNVIFLDFKPGDRIQNAVGYAPNPESAVPEMLVVEHPLVTEELLKDPLELVLWAMKIQIPVVLAVQPHRESTAETYVSGVKNLNAIREASAIVYLDKFGEPVTVLKHRDIACGEYLLPA